MKVLLKNLVYAFPQLRRMPALIFAIVVAFPLDAQLSPRDVVARAANLNDQGRFAEAIQTVGSFLAPGRVNEDALVGIAWNVRGVALENLGDWDEARRSYETAIAILRTKPDQVQQFASALDNLGSLKADIGQLQESRLLRIRARDLYRSVSDHAGTTRTSVNLVLVALALGDRKHARQFLIDASTEESFVPKPEVGDIAALSNARALESARDGHMNEALDEINHAIGLWTECYGPHYYLLASGLSLRGRINSALSKRNDALADFRLSLDILKMDNQVDSKVYFLVEKTYAALLRDSGQRDEADRLASEANRGLEGLRQKQCNACSVSAESFR